MEKGTGLHWESAANTRIWIWRSWERFSDLLKERVSQLLIFRSFISFREDMNDLPTDGISNSNLIVISNLHSFLLWDLLRNLERSLLSPRQLGFPRMTWGGQRRIFYFSSCDPFQVSRLHPMVLLKAFSLPAFVYGLHSSWLRCKVFNRARWPEFKPWSKPCGSSRKLKTTLQGKHLAGRGMVSDAGRKAALASRSCIQDAKSPAPVSFGS